MENSFRPTSFKVCARTFNIKYVKDSCGLDAGDMGCSNYDLGEIIIRTRLDGRNLPEDAIMETLFHELQHVIFWAAGLSELATSEEVVSQTSNIALQVWSTLNG